MEELRLKKLRWKSRRGMKELDVLFEAFFERQQEAVRAGGWPQLEDLLEQEDNVLFDWFCGRNTPECPEMKHLINKITDV